MKRKGEGIAPPFRLKHYDLQAWQDAMRLVRSVYILTTDFPDNEKFGLTSQMRRAAVSVPANIAEGAARSSRAEFSRFLKISRASLVELDTLLWLAKDIGLVAQISELRGEIETCFAKISGLIRSLVVRK